MNKEQLTTKLAATEASLKRWRSRLKRAATKVLELDKQQRRLETRLLAVERPMVATAKVKKVKLWPASAIEAKADFVQTLDEELDKAVHGKPVDMAKLDDLAVPAFLNRAADPLLAEKMTAARKADEQKARSAMPLSGKAALQFIKKGVKTKR